MHNKWLLVGHVQEVLRQSLTALRLYRLILHSFIPCCTHISLENCIDGVEFLLLEDDEVYRMVPPLGIAKKIIRLIPRPVVRKCIILHVLMIVEMYTTQTRILHHFLRVPLLLPLQLLP